VRLEVSLCGEVETLFHAFISVWRVTTTLPDHYAGTSEYLILSIPHQPPWIATSHCHFSPLPNPPPSLPQARISSPHPLSRYSSSSPPLSPLSSPSFPPLSLPPPLPLSNSLILPHSHSPHIPLPTLPLAIELIRTSSQTNKTPFPTNSSYALSSSTAVALSLSPARSFRRDGWGSLPSCEELCELRSGW